MHDGRDGRDTQDTPLTGGAFLVSIGDQDGRDASAGFADVVFPPFEHRASETPAHPDGAARAAARRHWPARSV
jgi:hypothetical protein